MPTLSRARTTLLTLSLLVASAVIAPVVAPAGAADTAPSKLLWQSRFGDGSAAAAASLGDSAVWDGRSNSSFGTTAGKAAWNVRTPANTRNGSKSRASFADLGFSPQRAVRLEYDVFIPSKEALALDIKLPGVGSAPAGESLWYASSGGNKEPDSGSIRIHVRPAGGWSVPHPYLEAYAYAHRGGGKTYQDYGLYWRLSAGMNATGHVDGDEFKLPVGTWSTIAIEAEMNSAGKADGKLRVWLNGRQGIDINDLEWVKQGPYTWTQTMNDVFYNVGSHVSTTWSIADMELRTLGSAPAPAPTTTAPTPAPTTTAPKPPAPTTTAPAPAPTTTAPAPAPKPPTPTTTAPKPPAPTTTAPAPAPKPPAPVGEQVDGAAARVFSSDVPLDNVHRPMIVALRERSIVRGCDAAGSRYCPSAPVTRGQMASFIARAVDLPQATRDHFPDDTGSPHQTSIDRLAEAGIVAGFTDGTFRPEVAVSRAQMATFLARAFGLTGGDGSRFVDVGGVHRHDIEAIAARGVTTGCSPAGDRYCPAAAVRRDQMASFIGRAMGL